MDTSDNQEKIIIIIDHSNCYRPRIFTKESIENMNQECIMCDYKIRFTTETENLMILPIEDSLFCEDIIGHTKYKPEDFLNDQQRFLKQREQKSFNRMRKGR